MSHFSLIYLISFTFLFLFVVLPVLHNSNVPIFKSSYTNKYISLGLFLLWLFLHLIRKYCLSLQLFSPPYLFFLPSSTSSSYFFPAVNLSPSTFNTESKLNRRWILLEILLKNSNFEQLGTKIVEKKEHTSLLYFY